MCELDMVNVFLSIGTIRNASKWQLLEDSEKEIQKMRKERIDLERVRERQQKEVAEARRKERQRFANKRRYNLIRNREPKPSSTPPQDQQDASE